jgi:isoquinoline 1-oxidoreductase beta subunit
VRRRSFLAAAAGAAVAGCTLVPVIPRRPAPDGGAALGWIRHRDGRFALLLPRAEMGQGIATALRQVACQELGAAWDDVDVEFLDTGAVGVVRATVGSESVQDFAEPLAQACAALRDALASGRGGPATVRDRPRAELRGLRPGPLVGASPPEDRAEAVVTGAPLFADDVRLEGMLHGRVLHAPASPETASAPAAWDEAAARATPGFRGLVADRRLRHGAGRGLGVLAATPGALDRVEAALAVAWKVAGLPAHADMAAAIDVDSRRAAGRLPHAPVRDRIDEAAPWDVDLRIDVPAAAHGAIEPRAAVARPDGAGGVEVWTGTQDPFYVRDALARALGLAEGAVRVRACRIGGGFGGRTTCTVELDAAVLALAAGRPVKVRWTRAQEYARAFHRPPVSHRVRARLEDGRLADWDHAFVGGHVLFTGAVLPAWLQAATDLFAGDGGLARGAVPPNRAARRRVAYDLVRLPVHTGPWRGLGAGPNGLAVESAVDEAARAAGRDPLAFRLDHLDDERLARVLARVGEISGWGAPRPAPSPGVRTGRGIGCGTYKGVSRAAVVADVEVAPDGTVRVAGLWCAHDCGLAVNPDRVRAQCEGNLVWSIGLVLCDRLPVEDGAAAARGFADAPIPTLSQVPDMTVDLVLSDAPPAGAGETVMAAAPGAIANAVRDATGVRPTRFPLDPADFRTA